MTEMKRLVAKLDAVDNVLVALTDLPSGSAVSFQNETFVLNETVKAKHKFFAS